MLYRRTRRGASYLNGPAGSRAGEGERFPRHWRALLSLIPILAISGDVGAAESPQSWRERFLAADRSLRDGDQVDYADLRAYPLYPYLRFRDLSKRLAELPAAEIREFLETQADTPLAGRLRDAWLRQLARAGRWDDYLRDALPSRDPTFDCWRRQALLKAGQDEPALRDFAALWLRADSLPAACDPVIAHWRSRSGPTPDLLWRRFALTMAQRNFGLARALRAELPATDHPVADAWLAVADNPRLLLEPARVQAIHDLAGGNPRLYIIFSDFLTVESLDDLVRPFEETADQQLTSYYQERLRWLSAQQREIVQYLCHQQHPVPVKQIAEGMFATHQTITNQLKILREYRYVRGNERGREVLYELAEPLMRLALQIKETNNREPLRLIVDFLRVWYDKAELLAKMENEAPGCAGRRYFEMAIQLLESSGENLRHVLLRHHFDGLEKEQIDDENLEVLKMLADDSGEIDDQFRVVNAMLKREDLHHAEPYLTRLLTTTSNLSPDAAGTLYNLRALARFQNNLLDSAYNDLALGLEHLGHKHPFCADMLLNQGYVSLAQRKHSQGIAHLREFCSHPTSLLVASTSADIGWSIAHCTVAAIFWSGATTKWVSLSKEFTGYFVHLELLPRLGHALLELLGKFDKSPFNHEALELWIQVWADATSMLPLKDRHHLEFPLGLLRVGINYLKTKNEGDLLTLPLEQRRILRQALGLEPESE